MVETVFQNCFVITYQNKLTLLTPFIQFLAILEKMKLVKFSRGNFSTPEGHDSHRTIGFFLPSKCLSNPVSHRFLKHVENKKYSNEWNIPNVSNKQDTFLWGNGYFKKIQSVYAKCKQGYSVFCLYLLYKSITPKISFHKIGSEGLKGRRREREHTPLTQEKWSCTNVSSL